MKITMDFIGINIVYYLELKSNLYLYSTKNKNDGINIQDILFYLNQIKYGVQ